MKNLLIAFTCLFLFAFFACKEDKHSIYESCCGTAPTADTFELSPAVVYLNDTIKRGYVYVPNIFIPDPNNVNSSDNLFMAFGDNRTVSQIILMEFSDENGEKLFSSVNFLPNDAGKSWDGLRADGSLYFGKFNYHLEVEFVTGQTKTYTGSACAVECGANDFPQGVLPDCFFPGQNNGMGGPDAAIPQPVDCF